MSISDRISDLADFVKVIVVCHYISTDFPDIYLESPQSLNNEGYDTTNITLIRQLKKKAGSDYRPACGENNKKQIYGPDKNQARGTTDEEFVEKATKKKLSV